MMRKTLTTAALVLALSCHAWAGIMHTPPAPESEPAQTNTALETAATDEEGGAADTLTQIALTLLVSVLP